MDAQNLISVDIPSNITGIGNNVFQGCSKLSTVKFNDDSVTSIGSFAFDNTYSLSSFVLPGQLATLGKSAFLDSAVRNNNELSLIVIPGTLQTVSDTAFYSACNFDDPSQYHSKTPLSVVIENGVKNLAKMCFGSYSSEVGLKLNYVEIPGSVTSIASNAFLNCREVLSVKVHRKRSKCVNQAGGTAQIMGYPWGLPFDQISDPNSTTEWIWEPEDDLDLFTYEEVNGEPKGAIKGLSPYAQTINPLDIVQSDFRAKTKAIMNGAFSGKSNIKSIDIPDTVLSVGDSVFNGCTGLSVVRIPESAEELVIEVPEEEEEEEPTPPTEE